MQLCHLWCCLIIIAQLNACSNAVSCIPPQVVPGQIKLPVIRAQQQARFHDSNESNKTIGNGGGGRAALLGLAAALSSTFSANACVIEEYVEKSKANKELNDKKRLATSGANFAGAYMVGFGMCEFLDNGTSCQELAKQKEMLYWCFDYIVTGNI